MSGISRLFTQSVTLETRLGTNALGDVFASPQAVPCFVEDRVKTVRSAQGEEAISQATLYASITAAPDSPPTAGQFAPGSRVTVNGRAALVITAARQDSAGPTRIHHTAAYLT